jgi:lysophospholipase L1-like esterase
MPRTGTPTILRLRAPLVVVALGDSTTAGTPGFRSPIEAPPDGEGDRRSQYVYWLATRHREWRVLNHGVNRERTEQIAQRFDRDVRPLHPDIIIVIAGVNDLCDGLSPAHAQRHLARIYESARHDGVPLVVAGSILPFDTASAAQVRYADALNKWIRDYAHRNPGVTFSDTRRAVAAAGAPNQLAASPDGLHPDVNGYRSMAYAIDRTITGALLTGRRAQNKSARDSSS